jgi:hypothetical protein
VLFSIFSNLDDAKQSAARLNAASS